MSLGEREPWAPMRAQGGGWGPPPGGHPPPGAPPGGYPPPGGYGGPPGGHGGPPGGYGAPPGGYGAPPGGYGAPPPAAKPITGSPQTMALYAMEVDPTTGLLHGEKPPASTAAVVAVVCGALLCLGPLTGVTAIIAGLMAMKAQKANPAAVGGRNMAITGLVLGSLNLVASLVFGFIFILSALL